MQLEKQKPWHGIGVDVDANLSSREMLYKAKLDWEVSKIPSQRPKSYANQETLRFFKGFFEEGKSQGACCIQTNFGRENKALSRGRFAGPFSVLNTLNPRAR